MARPRLHSIGKNREVTLHRVLGLIPQHPNVKRVRRYLAYWIDVVRDSDPLDVSSSDKMKLDEWVDKGVDALIWAGRWDLLATVCGIDAHKGPRHEENVLRKVDAILSKKLGRSAWQLGLGHAVKIVWTMANYSNGGVSVYGKIVPSLNGEIAVSRASAKLNRPVALDIVQAMIEAGVLSSSNEDRPTAWSVNLK